MPLVGTGGRAGAARAVVVANASGRGAVLVDQHTDNRSVDAPGSLARPAGRRWPGGGQANEPRVAGGVWRLRKATRRGGELLEPIKWYGRLLGEQALNARIQGSEMPQARPYTTDTALNRPVDALLPESFAAQRFARLLGANQPTLRSECTRLLGICARGGFPAELRGPVGQLVELLETVLAVLDGRIETARRKRPGCRGGQALRRVHQRHRPPGSGMADNSVNPRAVLGAAWRFDARPKPLGAGIIHDTFLVERDGKRMVLQRINRGVFRDPQSAHAQYVCPGVGSPIGKTTRLGTGADPNRRRSILRPQRRAGLADVDLSSGRERLAGRGE